MKEEGLERKELAITELLSLCVIVFTVTLVNRKTMLNALILSSHNIEVITTV